MAKRKRILKSVRRKLRNRLFGPSPVKDDFDKRVAPGAINLAPLFSRSLDDAVARLAPQAGKGTSSWETAPSSRSGGKHSQQPLLGR